MEVSSGAMKPTNPVPPQQVRHFVEERLRQEILSGEYKPGEWLRQLHLAKKLGVSEIPVREALKKLAAEGLIEYLPYRGMRVCEYSADDVVDVYRIRAYMEGLAASYAAEGITTEELDELKALVSEMEEHLAPEDLPEHRVLNRRFHEVVFTASRHNYLIHELRQLWMVFPSMLWGSFAATAAQGHADQNTYDETEHPAIIAALEEGNAEQAELMMRQHILGSGNRLFTAIKTDGNPVTVQKPGTSQLRSQPSGIDENDP